MKQETHQSMLNGFGRCIAALCFSSAVTDGKRVTSHGFSRMDYEVVKDLIVYTLQTRHTDIIFLPVYNKLHDHHHQLKFIIVSKKKYYSFLLMIEFKLFFVGSFVSIWRWEYELQELDPWSRSHFSLHLRLRSNREVLSWMYTSIDTNRNRLISYFSASHCQLGIIT